MVKCRSEEKHVVKSKIVRMEIWNKKKIIFLLEHGADVSMEPDWGRPYQIALSENKFEMAQYIKELEDPSLHDVKAREQFAREKNMLCKFWQVYRESILLSR